MVNKNNNNISVNNTENTAGYTDEKVDIKKLTLSNSLDANIQQFQNIFLNDDLMVVRKFENRYLDKVKCCVIYLMGMVKIETINDSIIKPILNSDLSKDICTKNLLEELKDKVLSINEITMTDNADLILEAILLGDTIFLLEGYNEVLILNSRGWKSRDVSEPQSARVIRGPREGFTESIKLNTSLIRRKIRNPSLKFKFREIGERTHTKICICYVEGIAIEEILKELERRLDKINIDSIIDSGYIQEFIQDAPFSPLETVGYSERPDVIAAKLLEGRIAIIVDGSPFVLTVPHIMVETFQASEDYYNNYIFASINRIMRSAAAILSITIPSLYLAVVTYHQEMLPTPLLLSIAQGRQGVPFPTVLSLIIMLMAFDLIREASIRMPEPIGQAINIVGSLILGQALAEAKLVSPHIIIITALCGILSLMSMSLLGAIILVRIFLLLATSFMGIYGFLFCFILVLIHLMSIRSFGVPYMLTISKIQNHDFQDVWIRVPWWEMTLRPKIIGARNYIRQSTKKGKGK
jgi:spore germination protein KA